MTNVVEELERQLRPEALLGLMASAVVLTLLGGFLYVVKPALAERRALAQDGSGSSVEEAESAFRASKASVASLEREVAGLRERLEGDAASVPTSQMESWIIDRMNQVSLRHGVQLRSVTPGQPGSVLGLHELPYDVDVAGTYFGLFAWLYDVEEALRPMVVKRFVMKRGRDGAGVKMNLRVVSYPSRKGDS